MRVVEELRDCDLVCAGDAEGDDAAEEELEEDAVEFAGGGGDAGKVGGTTEETIEEARGVTLGADRESE